MGMKDPKYTLLKLSLSTITFENGTKCNYLNTWLTTVGLRAESHGQTHSLYFS